MALLALVALTAQAGMLVQPEPHWGGVAPRYSGYYCDGRLKRTVPRRLGKGLHGEVLLAEVGQPAGRDSAEALLPRELERAQPRPPQAHLQLLPTFVPQALRGICIVSDLLIKLNF